MRHCLKILPKYYRDVRFGNKNFELRKNDRDFKVGDIIEFQEWDPAKGDYVNSESIVKSVEYVLKDCAEYGLKDGYCILGLGEAS